MPRLLVALAAVACGGVLAQKGSAFRCRDKDPMCEEWKGRGECEKNHDFMIDSCPVSCGMCENAKLKPTPAVFQMDFVCKGRLAKPPKSYKGTPADDPPDGCAFHCRDKLPTPMCKEQAATGACKEYASTMRFNCASTCGVCKGIGMANVSRDELPLPACEKKDEDGEAASCPAWAEKGECVKNFDYMKSSCTKACGLCAEDGQEVVAMEAALKPPSPPRTPKKKKGKKKKAAAYDGETDATAGAGADDGAAAEAKAEPKDELPEVRAAPVSGGAASAASVGGGAVGGEAAAGKEAAGGNGAPEKKKGWKGKVKEALGKIPGMKKKEKDEV